jgi:hypothetical protein
MDSTTFLKCYRRAVIRHYTATQPCEGRLFEHLQGTGHSDWELTTVMKVNSTFVTTYLLWAFAVASAAAFSPWRHNFAGGRIRNHFKARSPRQLTQVCSLQPIAESLSVLTSPEPIHSLFSVATFLPQPFWLLMILLPKWKWTKTIMGGLGTNNMLLRKE